MSDQNRNQREEMIKAQMKVVGTWKPRMAFLERLISDSKCQNNICRSLGDISCDTSVESNRNPNCNGPIRRVQSSSKPLTRRRTVLKTQRNVQNAPDVPESCEESKISNSPLIQMVSLKTVKTPSTSETENSSAESHPSMLNSPEIGTGSPEGKAIPTFDIFSRMPEEESKISPISAFFKSRFENFEEAKVRTSQKLRTLISATSEVVKEGAEDEEEIKEEIEEEVEEQEALSAFFQPIEVALSPIAKPDCDREGDQEDHMPARYVEQAQNEALALLASLENDMIGPADQEAPNAAPIVPNPEQPPEELDYEAQIAAAIEASLAPVEHIPNVEQRREDSDYEAQISAAIAASLAEQSIPTPDIPNELQVVPFSRYEPYTLETPCIKEECCICLEPFETGQSLITLQCMHTFHEHCIAAWADKSEVCPIDMEKVFR